MLKFSLTGVQLLTSPTHLIPQRLGASPECNLDFYDLVCVCGSCQNFLRFWFFISGLQFKPYFITTPPAPLPHND